MEGYSSSPIVISHHVLPTYIFAAACFTTCPTSEGRFVIYKASDLVQAAERTCKTGHMHAANEVYADGWSTHQPLGIKQLHAPRVQALNLIDGLDKVRAPNSRIV